MCSSDIFLGLIAILFPPIAGTYLQLPPFTFHVPLTLFPFLSSDPPHFVSSITLTHPFLLCYTVWVKRGLCSADSVINIALCMLGFFPGLLHAWYIIAKYPEPPEEYEALHGDGGEGRVTYYYVAQGPVPSQHQQQQGRRQQQQRAYGTNENIRVEGPKQDGRQPQQESGVVEERDGQGSSAGVPPSYEQAVRGDHKVQT